MLRALHCSFILFCFILVIACLYFISTMNRNVLIEDEPCYELKFPRDFLIWWCKNYVLLQKAWKCLSVLNEMMILLTATLDIHLTFSTAPARLREERLCFSLSSISPPFLSLRPSISLSSAAPSICPRRPVGGGLMPGDAALTFTCALRFPACRPVSRDPPLPAFIHKRVYSEFKSRPAGDDSVILWSAAV